MSAETSPQAVQGSGIMVSYRELVEIRTTMASMAGQLTAALALSGRVDSIDRRLGYLERGAAYEHGAKRTWKTVWLIVGTAVSSAVAGGALTTFLPRLMGWH